VDAVSDDNAARAWKAYEGVAVEMVAVVESKEMLA
jgi:hypothetical protein